MTLEQKENKDLKERLAASPLTPKQRVRLSKYKEEMAGWQEVYQRIEIPDHSEYEYKYVTFRRLKALAPKQTS